jgi:outer membrane protein OmpA-like peptidoglycan-associated protein
VIRCFKRHNRVLCILATGLGKTVVATAKIDGHTDSVGSEEYNLALSDRRAKAVFDYLTSRGVDPSRLKSQGFGESNPIAPNDTEAGRAQNRRVEITIVPVTKETLEQAKQG